MFPIYKQIAFEVEIPTIPKAQTLPLHSAHPQYAQNPMQVEQEVMPWP